MSSRYWLPCLPCLILSGSTISTVQSWYCVPGLYTHLFLYDDFLFMTILPLPAIDSVTPESATMLLTPFDAVRRWLDGCSFVLTDFSTYKDTFTNPDFYRLSLISCYCCRLAYICGITLTADGIRFYCFLFIQPVFECTQLSGLYGIYPYPYRFFEVDDLICNTLGGMIGFWITPALLFSCQAAKGLTKRRTDAAVRFRPSAACLVCLPITQSF